MAITGGVALTVCVPPATVIVVVPKQGELACGQKLNCQCEPCALIALFEGMETVYPPVPFSVPEIV